MLQTFRIAFRNIILQTESRHVVAAFMGLLLICAGCTRPSSLTVPLVLQPSDNNPPASLAGNSLKVYVQPVQDQRHQSDGIGQNTEESRPVPILSSGPPPAIWLHDSLASELGRCGVIIAPDAAGADRQIQITLNQFSADESPEYEARIQTTVQVQDSSGKVLWEGPAAGANSTHGRSLQVDNYQQVLSDAVVQLAANLVTNAGFSAAVTSPVSPPR